MAKNRPGIHKKLFKVLAFQLILISLVTLLSVFGAAKVVEDVLIKEALEGESTFFWEHYEKDKDFNLPKTLNLTGYLSDPKGTGQILKGLENLPLGYQRLEGQDKRPLVHISEKFGKKLYLVFEEGQVIRLALYFGIAPLAFILLIIYLPAWITYIFSKRAISPVIKLSKIMEDAKISERSDIQLDFKSIKTNADAEVMTLLESFEQYASQIDQYVHREHNFTRYASHELRTPLAVLKGSVSLLLKHDLNPQQHKIVLRMKPMIKEMEELLEALLLLSKNQIPQISKEPISVSELVVDQLEQIKRVFPDKNIKTSIINNSDINIKLPERLLSVCISNLLLNAFNYTDRGEIKAIINESSISIVDTGSGIASDSIDKVFDPFYRANRQNESTKGYGLGLSIVKRICLQMGWSVDVQSTIGIGTTVTLTIN